MNNEKIDSRLYEEEYDYINFSLPATNERLDVVLTNYLKTNNLIMSRSEVTKLLQNQLVLVDGVLPKKAGLLVEKPIDISISLPKTTMMNHEGEEMDLDIAFEDEHLLVINKQRGLVVHPAVGHPRHTLVNGLIYHFGNDLSNINGDFRPGIVHRIDKDTSGLLLIAKNNKIHQLLAGQLANHEIKRTYYAICHGQPETDKGTIDAPIGRDPNYRQKMAVVAGGKESVTHFKVLEKLNKTSFLELELETGRTHQIRVHLNYLRHPLVGDLLYAPKRVNYGLNGQALHAGKLKFTHPITGQAVEVNAELPPYFTDLLEQLR